MEESQSDVESSEPAIDGGQSLKRQREDSTSTDAQAKKARHSFSLSAESHTDDEPRNLSDESLESIDTDSVEADIDGPSSTSSLLHDKLVRNKYIQFLTNEVCEFFTPDPLGTDALKIDPCLANLRLEKLVDTVLNTETTPDGPNEDVGSNWSCVEKERFFWALSRKSRWQMDQVAQIVESKCEVECQAYSDWLQRCLCELKASKASRDQLLQNYLEIPFAYEFSDEWLKVEGRIAHDLAAIEAKLKETQNRCARRRGRSVVLYSKATAWKTANREREYEAYQFGSILHIHAFFRLFRRVFVRPPHRLMYFEIEFLACVETLIIDKVRELLEQCILNSSRRTASKTARESPLLLTRRDIQTTLLTLGCPLSAKSFWHDLAKRSCGHVDSLEADQAWSSRWFCHDSRVDAGLRIAALHHVPPGHLPTPLHTIQLPRRARKSTLVKCVDDPELNLVFQEAELIEKYDQLISMHLEKEMDSYLTDPKKVDIISPPAADTLDPDSSLQTYMNSKFLE